MIFQTLSFDLVYPKIHATNLCVISFASSGVTSIPQECNASPISWWEIRPVSLKETNVTKFIKIIKNTIWCFLVNANIFKIAKKKS